MDKPKIMYYNIHLVVIRRGKNKQQTKENKARKAIKKINKQKVDGLYSLFLIPRNKWVSESYFSFSDWLNPVLPCIALTKFGRGLRCPVKLGQN